MAEVFLERSFDPPLAATAVQKMAAESDGCFNLHRVNWRVSFLSHDGRDMVCRFSGPDAESVRLALREAGADVSGAWSGSVHYAPDVKEGGWSVANTLVARAFDEPVKLADMQALGTRGAWCLDAYNVKFVCTFFAASQRRMLCLYHAPDAESVRMAQRQAGMPVERVWAFSPVRPDA